MQPSSRYITQQKKKKKKLKTIAKKSKKTKNRDAGGAEINRLSYC
jgi:hypothetical protein